MAFDKITDKIKDLSDNEKVKDGLDKAAEKVSEFTSKSNDDSSTDKSVDKPTGDGSSRKGREEHNYSESRDKVAKEVNTTQAKTKLYKGLSRGATLRLISGNEDGKSKGSYEVIDPKGSDLKKGQKFELLPNQVEKL